MTATVGVWPLTLQRALSRARPRSCRPRSCGPDPDRCATIHRPAPTAAGGSAVPLDPVARKLLDEVAASGRPNAHLLPVAEARVNFESLFAGLGPGEEVAAVADHAIPVAGGEIPARSYRPAGSRRGELLPLVVYFHGGGWLLGSVESHDGICRVARERLGRRRAQRRLPARRPRRASRPLPTTRSPRRAGRTRTPRRSAPTRAGSPSPATRPAATSRPSSARTCATRASRSCASSC